MPEYNNEQLALSKLRLENAQSDLESAQIEFDHEHYKAANNRAYYCIFHAVRAVLALESADFKSHGQLLGYFNKNYIHSGIFDISFSKAINKAKDLRTNSDYDDFFIAVKEDSLDSINGARKFLGAISSYLSVTVNSEPQTETA